MQNEGGGGIPDNPREQQYERILKAREAAVKAQKENKVVAFEETEKGEGRKEKRQRKHEWMADKKPIKRFIGTHLMHEPSKKVPVSVGERVDGLTNSPNRLKKFFGWCLKVGIPVVVVSGAVIFLYGKLIVGSEVGTSGITVVDRANRQDRYAYYSTDDGIANTDAEKWQSGKWTGYSSHDFFVNLDPTRPYTEPKAFVDKCGPQCFFDPKYFPRAGWPMMEELLGLTPGEYQYYSDHLSEWNSVKGDLIDRLEKKYPNESDRWFPEMFNLSPTDFNSKQPSDFENWYNKWHEPSGSTKINSVKDRIHAEGYQQWKNPFKGQQNFAGARAKGRGFGTSKGFS